ncbi:hypothetical protein [Pseudomonas alabamensis]|uniref:hypothetical protein n=1 Tax=Pseudomonas alabamensis TaxID=3064349 RepID=UPI0016426DB0
MNLQGKIVVLTGNSRGLGQATAIKLKQLGATVIGLDILPPWQTTGWMGSIKSIWQTVRQCLRQSPP